jgi:anti-anti-sigma factor
MNSDSGISTRRVADHVWLVTAPGERDIADAIALRAEVDRVFASGSVLVFDLTDTTFIDSAVVGVIAYAAERADEHTEHRVVVVAPPDRQPRRVLDLVGAAGFAAIADDVQTAVGSA